MRLDTKALRYLTNEDWRVLTAVEQGSRNHEVVPTPLIQQIAGLRGGSGVHKCISTLAKANLIARQRNAKYDGYRLTYGGLDYLALHTHTKKSIVFSVGNQIGVGKESDIFVVASPAGVQHVLKIHRLGRISFRTVKANRDYLRKRNTGSWMYMSRLAATKEFAFMSALHEAGFPVPTPIMQNRHTLVMEMIDAFPLRQIDEVPDPAGLYAELMELIVRLAGVGLIHGDFNEFNLLIKEEAVDGMEKEKNDRSSSGSEPSISKDGANHASQPGTQDEQPPKLKLVPIIIDFPQMVSVDHPNAEMYFDRDVACIRRFFERRFGFTSDASGPFLKDGRKRLKKGSGRRLDVEVEASGFSRKMAKELEQYMTEVGVKGDGERGEQGTDGEEENGDSEEEDAESDEESEDGQDGEDEIPPVRGRSRSTITDTQTQEEGEREVKDSVQQRLETVAIV